MTPVLLLLVLLVPGQLPAVQAFPGLTMDACQARVQELNAAPPDDGWRTVGACVTPAQLLALSLQR
jgi:hypothetical protein